LRLTDSYAFWSFVDFVPLSRLTDVPWRNSFLCSRVFLGSENETKKE
jgi:hypothetical protein